ncbi:hypothetical protein V6N13_018808 [Hibiscus sabdariffa]|uniref:Uncharacterized protein n=1 Tax=Hibiscus sabdariffa TaxID=183260 RepID=A0ABR2EKV7_9ROSI
MPTFDSSSSVITPDYFGDELGSPPRTIQLRGVANQRFNKAVTEELKNGFINCIQMVENRGKPRQGEPILDGLFCFETLVISNVK